MLLLKRSLIKTGKSMFLFVHLKHNFFCGINKLTNWHDLAKTRTKKFSENIFCNYALFFIQGQGTNLERKCLKVHTVCSNFGLNVPMVCTNFSLNVHTPIYKRAPNDLKTLPMGIIHDYMSCWTTLRPFRYPRGPQNGPKQHRNGPEWLKTTRMAQNGTAWPQMTLKHFRWVYYMIICHVGPPWAP